jgi:hypothetical protein
MPILTQLLSDDEARDFEFGAKRDPFVWYNVTIVPNEDAIIREISILKLLSNERGWEMPGWDDVDVDEFVRYFCYLVDVRVASAWNEELIGKNRWIPPTVGTRKNLPMPATWLAYLEAIGVVYNRTENYGLRPFLEGSELPADGQRKRLPEMSAHEKVVNYLYAMEQKRIIPIVRGLPRDVEGVSHVMHMQYVDNYFKTHQADSTPNAAWVAGYLVRNRLDRFQPFVKYFTPEEHLEQVGRIATREYRIKNRQNGTGKPQLQKPKASDDGSAPNNATAPISEVVVPNPPESTDHGTTATQE